MAERKTLQDLTIKDNFMFGAVMMDEEICRELLEFVLGFRIAKVTVSIGVQGTVLSPCTSMLSKEKCFVYHPEYKGVRLDILAADEKNTHYNVEMQVFRKRKPGKRSRYYHSQIDMELLRSGQDYEELPDSYVIFICDFDPFYRKKYRYTFDMTCREDGDVALEDGSHTVFLSTCGENEDEVPAELVKFLKYVKAGLKESSEDFQDSFVKRVQIAVRNVKASREMEEQYMLLEELIKEEREQALAEGRELGLTEGISQGQISSILELLSYLGEVPEEIKETVSEENDPEVLKLYLRQAAAAKSMDDFRQFLDGRKSK